MECVICYDELCMEKNCITTECGHQFHASCLMKHAAFNGFDCPMCRAVMAEEPEESEHGDEFEDEDDGETIGTWDTDCETNDNYILDGFRWLFQQAEGTPIDYIVPYSEEYEHWKFVMDNNQDTYEQEADRRTKEVVDELKKFNGLTFEDLIKCALYENDEYFTDSSEHSKASRKVRGTISGVLRNLMF